MHTTTGLRLLRALAEHGESVPSYLEPADAVPARRPAATDRSALAAAAGPTAGRTTR